MKSLGKSKNTSNTSRTRTKSKVLDKPFKDKDWEQARKTVSDYQIVIKKDDSQGYIGVSLEIPTVFAEGSTPSKCYDATQEALRVTVATMIECGTNPPHPFSPKKRTVQVNIRLNNEEKLQLAEASMSLGFKGLSDFIRNCALERIHSNPIKRMA